MAQWRCALVHRLSASSRPSAASHHANDSSESTLNTLSTPPHSTHTHTRTSTNHNHTNRSQSHQIKEALDSTGLKAAGVAVRFPESFSRLAALSSPDQLQRFNAMALAAQACHFADRLGAAEVVVWPQHDGYDYHLQVDYEAAWEAMVEAYRHVARGCPGKRVSVEWKPTDPSARHSLLPSTAAALMLAQEVGAPNFGVTLDAGHCLAAGENPAQSAALLAAAGKLFGVHLNDGPLGRPGAEDGLMFGSAHGAAALELVHWLRRSKYAGAVYFDTFPVNEDPGERAGWQGARARESESVCGAVWCCVVGKARGGVGARSCFTVGNVLSH